MSPQFIYIRCVQCGRVYRTSAGIAYDRLVSLLPVLRLISAKCPYCGQINMVGDAEICAVGQHAA
jgi:phage FluMu protein Com